MNTVETKGFYIESEKGNEWWAGKTEHEVTDAYCAIHHEVLRNNIKVSPLSDDLPIYLGDDDKETCSLREFLDGLVTKGISFPAHLWRERYEWRQHSVVVSTPKIKVFMIERKEADGPVYEWWAGRTEDEVLKAYCVRHDVSTDGLLVGVLSDEEMEEAIYIDGYTEETCSFREFLDRLISKGVPFPGFFAEEE